jgi:glucose/arabinose dehydrogenase
VRRRATALALAALVIIISAGCGSTAPTRTSAAGGLAAIGRGVHGPSGLVASVEATGLKNVAALAVDDSGRVWAGTADYTDSGKDRVVVVDRAGAKPTVVLTAQRTVLGLLWYQDSLYVASSGGVVAYGGFDGSTFASHRVVVSLPSGSGEVNQLALAPNGTMLLGVSSPCDHCTTTPQYSGAVLSFLPDGTGLRAYATGIRAPVGIGVIPGTSQVLVTMNQRDDLGSKTPGDWLAVVADGSTWGFPGCYGQGGSSCTGVPQPLAALDKHAAVSGVAIVSGQLGSKIGTSALVAEWATGVVERVPLSSDGTAATAKPSRFLTGIGKPVAIIVDGSTLLVGDWASGTIYRISP